MNRQDKAGHQEENCFTFYIILLSVKDRLIDNCDFDRSFLHLLTFLFKDLFFAFILLGGIEYIVMNMGHIFMEA